MSGLSSPALLELSPTAESGTDIACRAGGAGGPSWHTTYAYVVCVHIGLPNVKVAPGPVGILAYSVTV